MEVWMGPEYANWTISAIFAAGYLLPVSQSALLRILVGMDVHGGIAKISAAITTAAVAIGLLLTLISGWSLVIASLLTAVPVTLGIGLTVLVYGFRYLKISFAEYFRIVMLDGIVLLASICAALFALRVFSVFSPFLNLTIGLCITGLVVLILHAKDLKRLLAAIRR